MAFTNMLTGIEYPLDPTNFFVRYNAPRRNYYGYREECNNDALTLKSLYSKFYILFSSGVDSQVITRTFLDNKIDAEYIFLNPIGLNPIELAHINECEKFYGIKINVINIDINQRKDEWISRSETEKTPNMFHYPFEWLSSILPEKYPIVTQGISEPAIIGMRDKVSIYHNYYEGVNRRSKLMGKYRQVFDFPFSPEYIASYYTDIITKSFSRSIQSFYEMNLQDDTGPISKLSYWEHYGKSMMKANYFKDDIIWYGKRTGYESYPNWFKPQTEIKNTRVSVPYWGLVDFLENHRNEFRDYKGWVFKEDTPGFVEIS